MSRKKESGILIENRRAHFEYFLSDFMTAGLVLTGTEIKSLRSKNATISDAYIFVKHGEAFVCNMHIAPYKEGNIFNVDHLRDRKLLLNKQEIKKLASKIAEQGHTCVPTKVFLSHGYAKMEIALAKGKQLHDKKNSLKEKDIEREIDRHARSSKDFEDF
ncbi:MAG: SsrA-binding protein SmpB [Bacilli bacterium]|nr:SsrA-binding protein SmpB [Bacilli bacterium]